MIVQVSVLHKPAPKPPIDRVEVELTLSNEERKLLIAMMRWDISIPALLYKDQQIAGDDIAKLTAMMQQIFNKLDGIR